MGSDILVMVRACLLPLLPLLSLLSLLTTSTAWTLVRQEVRANGTVEEWREPGEGRGARSLRCPHGTGDTLNGDFGGSGGNDFHDGNDYMNNGFPTGMEVRAGVAIDSIRVKYGPNYANQHGGNGGSLNTFTMDTGGAGGSSCAAEFITRVQGRHGQYIDQVQFTTSRARTFGPYGGGGGSSFDVNPNNGACTLTYISGKSGIGLDHLVLHWVCP